MANVHGLSNVDALYKRLEYVRVCRSAAVG
jgi:hypothetical protein